MTNKKKRVNETLHFFKDNSVFLLGLIFAVINLWLATKLSPISEGISKLSSRVEANTVEISTVKEACETSEKNIEENLNYLRSKVDNIYTILLDL